MKVEEVKVEEVKVEEVKAASPAETKESDKGPAAPEASK